MRSWETRLKPRIVTARFWKSIPTIRPTPLPARWREKSWNNERQPSALARHPTRMRIRLIAAASMVLILAALSACTSNESPDEIRQKTARDTAALKRDTKAVAEGIKEGLTSKKSIDLNKASK